MKPVFKRPVALQKPVKRPIVIDGSWFDGSVIIFNKV
jgi:hypothetical protein